MKYFMNPGLLDVAASWADWMLAMSWQVALLAVIVWMITRLFRRTSAAFRFALWGLVFVKLAIPPDISTPWSVGNLGNLAPSISVNFDVGGVSSAPAPSATVAAPVVRQAPAPAPAKPAPPANGAVAEANPPTQVLPRAVSTPPAVSVPPAPMAATPAAPTSDAIYVPPVSSPLDMWWSWTIAIMWVWGLVAAGMFASIVIRAVAYHRHISRDLEPLDPALAVIVEEQAARLGLGHRFAVRVSPHLVIPTVCMLRRPTVLLPDRLAYEISREQFANLMGHELAHIKRHDLEWGWIATLLLCLYWFHPAVWVATFNLRREREMACDDEVLYTSRPESKEYAATILRVAEEFDGSMPAGSGFLGLFEVGEHLLHRIRSISDATRPRRAGAKSVIFVVLAALALIPMGIWSSSTSAQENQGIDQEIAEHYAKADPEVVDFIRVTAARFGPEGLWLAADTFGALTPEERAAKVETVRAALEGSDALNNAAAIAEAGALADSSFITGLTKIAWYMREGGQDNQAKWMAVAALGRIGDKKAVPTLIPLVDHYNKNVRMWARASLVRLSNENFGADKQAWANWANAAGPETAIAPATLEWASQQSEEKMSAQLAAEEQQAALPSDGTTTAIASELPTLAELPASAADIPGEVLFKGTYVHKSRGSQLQQPSTVTIKSTDNVTEAVAICEFPAMETTFFARYDNPHFTTYSQRSTRGGTPTCTVMDVDEESVRVHYIGGEKDGQTETYSIPKDAIFDPNTRPDPYVASFLLQEIYDNAKKTDFTVFDWDNSGKGMASYAIRIENQGQETVTVPAGSFTVNHIVQTQTTFGDTWFKKRPGHVTEYWIDADSNIIVRILRHREPYEVLLASVEVGAEWLNPLEGEAAKQAQETYEATQSATPQGQLEAAANEEIAAHYTTAAPEVQEYMRWTARTFGPGHLWQPADAFASLTADAREQKVQQMVGVLNGEYGRHLCETLADAGAIKDPRLVPGLTKHAAYHREDSNYDCRPKWMAVSALGRQDDIAAVPTLIPLVDHGNENTRTWARASLSRLTGQNFGEDKKAWARWWNDSGHEPKVDVDALKAWARAAPAAQPASPATAPPTTAPAQPPAEIEATLPVVGSPFTVPANVEPGNEWLRTGMIMPHGAVFELHATGSVLWDRNLARVGPAGAERTPAQSCSDPQEFPLPDAPCGALVGRIDRSGSPFLVGEGTHLTGGGGYLFLTINDRFGAFADNAGEFVVNVTTSKSPHYSTQPVEAPPAQLQVHGTVPQESIPEEAEAIAAGQPGKLAFKAIYQHKSGGIDVSGLGVVWGKRTEAREFSLTSYLPATNATYVGFVQPGVESFRRYEVHSHGLDGQPPSQQITEISTGSLAVRHIGGEKDGQVDTISIPMDSAFEPNGNPDPYAAIMAIIGYGLPRDTREVDLNDWDATHENMALYRIRLEYTGQEEVTVPLGTFMAYHFVETQLTTGNTAFDKQAGDITEYWWLDGGMVVRILRHRGPYELVLVGAETPVALPGQIPKPTAAKPIVAPAVAAVGDGSTGIADVAAGGDKTVVSGRVSDVDGQPIAGARVSIKKWESGEHFYSEGTTDAEGRFSLDAKPSNARLFAYADGYASMYRTHDVGEGANPGWDFTLPKSAHVSGRLVDTKGRPVPDRVLELWTTESGPPPAPGLSFFASGGEGHDTVDADGNFDMPNVAPGTHAIVVYKSVPSADRCQEQSPVEGRFLSVKAGERVEDFVIVVNPPEDFAISGHVRNAKGEPVAEVGVDSFIPHGRHWWTQTDASGAFRLEALDGIGQSVMKVHFNGVPGAGGYKLWLPEVPLNSQDVNLVIPDHGVVHGVVRNGTGGEAITAYEVSVPVIHLPDSGAVWEEPQVDVTKNADNTFTLAKVPAGLATIQVKAGGLGVQRFDLAVKPNETNELACDMLGPAVFEGTTTMDGKPKGVGVIINGEWLNSDDAGKFRFDTFPNGGYTVWFFEHDGWHRSADVTLKAGETTRLDMEMGGSNTIRGTVNFPKEESMCTVRLSPKPAPDGWYEFGRPDPKEYVLAYSHVRKSGETYELRGIPKGKWYLMAGAYRPQMHRSILAHSQEIEVNENESLTIDLDLTKNEIQTKASLITNDDFADSSGEVVVNRQEAMRQLQEDSAKILTEMKPKFERGADGNTVGVTSANISWFPLAKEVGLQDNDLVTSINGERIDSPEKLSLVMQNCADTPTVRLGIERNGQPLELNIRLE